MKKIAFSIAALALFTSVGAQQLDRSVRPKAGPAPEIKLADAKTFTLANGLKVFVVENHKLSTVTYSILLDVHPLAEGNKAGISEFVGPLVTAGNKKMNKEQFDEATDMIGASINASSRSISGSSLVKHQEKMLQLMSDALLQPNFQQSELDKLKKQTEAGLAQAKNEPDAMLENVSSVLNYGKEHPYGEVATEQTVSNITLADCNAYFQTYFRPNVAYLAIVGDVSEAEAKKMAEKYFGAWQKGTVPEAKYPAAPVPQNAIVQFVPREGAVQSVIGVTYPVDLKPGTPDVIKARVLNEVLGGSSQGRLFLNLREKHGWTYGSYSTLSADEVVGHFQAYAKARNEVTDSSVNEILNEMNNIRNTPVNDADLKNMLSYMTGTFAIGLENPATIAQYAINIDRYNMPKDYYKNYLKNLNAITAADVQATAAKYIDPAKANIIVVGDKAEAAKLKRFSTNGQINYYDNYGNPVQEAKSEAVADGVTAASVMDSYFKAIGGRAAIEGLKDLKMTASIEMGGQQARITQKMKSPAKYLMSVDVPGMGTVQKIVVDGDKGTASGMGQTQELPADQVASMKEQADLQAELHPEKYAKSYKLVGQEQLDGNSVYVIEKAGANADQKEIMYIDQKTGYKVREIAKSAEGVQISNYANYKEVKNGNGFKVPYSIEISGGPAAQKLEIQSVEANSGISDADFK